MGKIKFIITIIVLIYTTQLYSQIRFDYPVKIIEPVEYIAVYSLKYQQDSTNPDFIINEDMYLFLGKNVSYFISANKYTIDTMYRKVKNVAQFQQMLKNPNLPIARIRYKIYKNYPKGKITFIEHIPSNTFRYEEDLNIFKWQLTMDTSTIKGYHVQKAICDYGGRKWIAWFTTQIPYSDGPYKFNGLPGLILKIGDTRNHYVFELVSFDKPKKQIMIDIVEKEYVKTTKTELFRAKDNFRNDIMGRAKDAGFEDKEAQGIYLRMAQRNNPIELKRK